MADRLSAAVLHLAPIGQSRRICLGKGIELLQTILIIYVKTGKLLVAQRKIHRRIPIGDHNSGSLDDRRIITIFICGDRRFLHTFSRADRLGVDHLTGTVVFQNEIVCHSLAAVVCPVDRQNRILYLRIGDITVIHCIFSHNIQIFIHNTQAFHTGSITAVDAIHIITLQETDLFFQSSF